MQLQVFLSEKMSLKQKKQKNPEKTERKQKESNTWISYIQFYVLHYTDST